MTELYEIFTRHPEVTTDSRNIPQGSIFFALRGGKFDGNRFAADALAKGAAYAVVDDPAVAVSERYIVVPDVLSALQELAAEHRRALGIPILAITGTNGKTTTKELLTRVMSERFSVSATKGNLNNHIGVPLTLLSMGRDAGFGIVEMGAGARGEIALLCRIAQPDYGLITNIGRAHLEGFGSPEGVKQGKGELYDYLAEHEGLAFWQEENEDLRDMVAARPGLRSEKYSVHCADGIESHLTGDYNKLNIAAAVAIGAHFGIDRRVIADAIAGYVPDNNRSQRMETGRNTLILDCYNANPSSMRAAISNFAAMQSDKPKAVILGDMLELGEYSMQEHTAIVDLLREKDFSHAYLVGGNFYQVLGTTEGRLSPHTKFRFFTDTAKLAYYLDMQPLDGCLVLLKGSRGIGLESLVETL